ncbi:MAG: hypothetical protein JO023_16560 [Chloroflexi bacterium]|nr:hypothetical protein [Chloroflexota bacterium]
MDIDTGTNGRQQRHLQRAGVWCAGRLSGSYRASSGPRDDYLELQLGHGRFTGRRLNGASAPSQDVSIRYADRGRRLVVLRLTTAGHAARERDWSDRAIARIA